MKKGWETKRLGEVCEVIGGGTPAKNNAAFYTGAIPWATVRDMRQDEITETEFRITKEAVRSSATNIVPAGNVVIATRVGLGKICLLGQDTAINQDLRGIIPRDEKSLTSRYLFWWFKSIAKEIVAEGKGATVQGVKLPFVKSLPIPVPPLPEQRRIVGLLDEAFAVIATAKANAEKNLQNAREIFESHLNEVFAKQWESGPLVALEELAVAITDGDHLPPPKSPKGFPFITIGNIVKETRTIDFSDTFMVPRSYFNALKTTKKPRKGDVLYTVTGSYGIPVLLRDDAEFCFQRHIGLVRPKPETNSSWLYFLLMSPQVFKQAEEGATGTAQRTVSLKLLRSFVVPKLSQKHQEQAVKRLDALSAETRRLAAIYSRKLAALEELKQALLHRAFSGEL